MADLRPIIRVPSAFRSADARPHAVDADGRHKRRHTQPDEEDTAVLVELNGQEPQHPEKPETTRTETKPVLDLEA